MFTRFSVACFCGNVYAAPPNRCSVCGRTFASESMYERRRRASRAPAGELEGSAPAITGGPHPGRDSGALPEPR